MSPASPTQGVDGVNVLLLAFDRRVHIDDIKTAAEGQGYLDEIDGAIDQIENQLSGPFAAAREATDPDWRRLAEIALKRKRRSRPRLQQRISELRRAEKPAALPKPSEKEAATLRRAAFINAAEEMLDHETFTEIWARAQETRPEAFAEAQAGGLPA